MMGWHQFGNRYNRVGDLRSLCTDIYDRKYEFINSLS